MVLVPTSYLLLGLTVNNDAFITLITLKEYFHFCISLFHFLLFCSHILPLKYSRHLGHLLMNKVFLPENLPMSRVLK